MRRLSLAPFVLFLAAATAHADTIGYPTPGVVAPGMQLFATNSGEVTGYFYGSAAGGTDYVRLVDLTSGYASLFLLDNHASNVGQSVSFGTVNAGDRLAFELVNSDVETSDGYRNFTHLGPIDPNARQNQYLLTTDPSLSVDGLNHGYVTAFSGDLGSGIPAGLFVGMEDLPSPFADYDYDDTQFVFTNVTATTVTPEPGSCLLLGTGLLATLLPLRRRFVMR